MGTKLSVGLEEKYHPDIAPRTDRPPTFDPLYGFPNGRKPRVMIATQDEMDRWNIPMGQRDYCAHMLIPFLKCQTEKAPFASYYCLDVRHALDKCEYRDHIMRIKEFERERRLLKRMKRKKEAAKAAGQGTEVSE